MKIKITMADDHVVVLQGLQKMLADYPGFEILDTYLNGEALLKGLIKKQPDVLLLDIQMPGKQGDELAQLVTDKYPHIAVIALTNMDQTFHVRNMFLNGAKGYLLKSADQFTLIRAIESVYNGNQYIDDALREQMVHEMLETKASANKVPTLTRREKEILTLIGNEQTSAEIARALHLSLSTVENHRLNIFFKLGVKNVAGLVKKAIQLGLIR